jgi:neutral trehalase
MKEAQAKKVEAETKAKLSEVAAEGAVDMAKHDTFEADEAQELVQNRTRGDEEELKVRFYQHRSQCRPRQAYIFFATV